MFHSEFLHVGITVSDIKKTIDFYTKYFKFQLEMEGVFEKSFISSHSSLYQLKEGAYSDFCFLKAPNGIVLEVFQFHPTEDSKGENGTWNRPGYTHICLKVDDIFKVYNEMKKDGIEFFFPPDVRATPEEHWVFLKDPDGNLIELQD